MTKKIIDVSEFQRMIDWEKVKTQVDGAILRCGYGSDIKSQDDKMFERNAFECERLGIPFGVYLVSYAKNESMAKSEAAHILRLIEGKKLTYPIYLDCEIEEDAIKKYTKTACEIIGNIITDARYTFGVYANTPWWNNYLVGMDKYSKWVAQYNNVCQYKGSYDIWQYTSKGKINGIKTNVDLNYCYKDFTNASKPTPTPTPQKKSIHEVALEVIDGKWGTASTKPTRKESLKSAGYTDAEVTAIQNEVNAILNANNNKGMKVKIVAKDGLNIRKGAGTSYAKVSAIPKGKTVIVEQESKGWGYVTYNGIKGWICLAYTVKA